MKIYQKSEPIPKEEEHLNMQIKYCRYKLLLKFSIIYCFYCSFVRKIPQERARNSLKAFCYNFLISTIFKKYTYRDNPKERTVHS